MYYLDKILLNKGIKRLNPDEVSISLLGKQRKEKASLVNQKIFDAIISGEPFLVGRFGANELSMMKTIEFDIKNKYPVCTEMMHTNAGFFPNDTEMIKGFLPLMHDFCRECDVLGTWNQPFEGYFIDKYMKKDVVLTSLECLEPWYYPKSPWSAALEGKKVLVIHPFVESITEQYKKRISIYPNTNILPEFELKTFKAVQTIAGNIDDRFQNWYEALHWMYEQVMKIDFDIAILGCGAYGAPLATKIKKSGKQAIHLGGATQILFGIIGQRWLSNDFYSYVRDFINSSWVHPCLSECVSHREKVENSCYW